MKPTKKQITEAIATVRNHNRWRRGEEGATMENPKRLGCALDTLCDAAEALTKPTIMQAIIESNKPKPQNAEAIRSADEKTPTKPQDV